jgi:hypothetical protein
MTPKPQPSPQTQAAWNSLYRLAGGALLLAVCITLVDIGMSFTGGDVEPGTLSADGWFALLQGSGVVGLRNLGIFNVAGLLLMAPVYLALAHAHRSANPPYAVLAFVLFLIGTTTYVSNNRALAMLDLSRQYAAAGETQRALVASAGTALLAQAEDFTPGTFTGFFLTTSASLLISAVMLRGRVFRPATGWVGLVGSACLLVFTVLATFVPGSFTIAMRFALPGGLRC